VKNVLKFFKEHMPESLYDDIDLEIGYQIRYNDAKETIEREGASCFEDMSEAVYKAMTLDDLIERYLDDNADGIFEFLITSIELKN
jgi:hypothetical protein